jgi:hypothetical protein
MCSVELELVLELFIESIGPLGAMNYRYIGLQWSWLDKLEIKHKYKYKHFKLLNNFKILKKVTVQVRKLNMFEMYSASKLQIMESSFKNNQINFSLFPNKLKFKHFLLTSW